jgi:hypothetical protein
MPNTANFPQGHTGFITQIIPSFLQSLQHVAFSPGVPKDEIALLHTHFLFLSFRLIIFGFLHLLQYSGRLSSGSP